MNVDEKDTALDQDCGTESHGVCMYTGQCRVIVDNKCETHDDCTFYAKLLSKTRKDQQTIVSETLSGRPSFTDSK